MGDAWTHSICVECWNALHQTKITNGKGVYRRLECCSAATTPTMAFSFVLIQKQCYAIQLRTVITLRTYRSKNACENPAENLLIELWKSAETLKCGS